MKITPRCINLLKLLRTARWLSTSQIQRRFWPVATADAVRKRLRKLTADKYLFMVRRDRMSQALFTIGIEGRRILEKLGSEPVALERKPPIQREHFLAINDCRLSAELSGDLKYFYTAWELPGLGWREEIIPDGLMAFDTKTFALEFDRGVEGVAFFVRTKMSVYERGFASIATDAVIIVADRTPRMTSLAKAMPNQTRSVLFTTLEQIQRHTLFAPIFYTIRDGWGVRLFPTISSQTILTTRELSADNNVIISDLQHSLPSLLSQGEQQGINKEYGGD